MTYEAALAAVESWPVPNVAAAVVGTAGIVASLGDVDATYRLASVTKPLTSMGILVAVEEGAVSLEDAADEDVIPGATLRHLLSHASGYAPDKPMRSFAPAVRRVYSNVGIERAAWLVEQATGMTFATYLDEAIFGPLKMSATTLPASPAWGGFSSVRDLARVVQELLAPSGLLSPATLTDLRTVQYPGLRGVLPGFRHQDPNDWGLGFEIRGRKSPHWTGNENSPETYGHFGQSGTFVWIDPAAQLGLVALTDRDFGPWAAEVWPALSDAILAAE